MLDSANNAYVAGGSDDYIFILIKYNGLTGDTLWTAKTPKNKSDYGYLSDFKMDEQGNTYFTGSIWPVNGHRSVITVKYDSRGKLIWQTSLRGSKDSSYYSNSLLYDSTGCTYLTYTVLTDHIQPPPGSDVGYPDQSTQMLLKYDLKGKARWRRMITGKCTESSSKIFYLLGYENFIYALGAKPDTTRSSSIYQFHRYIVRYDVSGKDSVIKDSIAGDIYDKPWIDRFGNMFWVEWYYNGPKIIVNDKKGAYKQSLPVHVSGNIEATIAGASGNMYTTGWNQTIGSNLTVASQTNVIVKFNADGTIGWKQDYFNGLNCAIDISLDNEGSAILAGSLAQTPSGDNHPLILKYNDLGSKTGEVVLDTIKGYFSSLKTDKVNNVYVAGSVYENGTYHIITKKYSQITVGIENAISLDRGLKIYPNPSAGDVNIVYNEENTRSVKVQLYDAYGQEIIPVYTSMALGLSIKRNNLKNGLYLLKITNRGNIITTYKLFFID